MIYILLDCALFVVVIVCNPNRLLWFGYYKLIDLLLMEQARPCAKHWFGQCIHFPQQMVHTVQNVGDISALIYNKIQGNLQLRDLYFVSRKLSPENILKEKTGYQDDHFLPIYNMSHIMSDAYFVAMELYICFFLIHDIGALSTLQYNLWGVI